MIVTCTNCTTRLQLEDSKLPSRPFTVRCPKCHQMINAQPPAAPGDGSALAANGDLPASARRSRDPRTSAAPDFRLDTSAEGSSNPVDAPPQLPVGEGELARLLVSLLQQNAAEKVGSGKGEPRRAWERRRALICTAAAHRNNAARVLVKSQYEVFVAEDTTQAIEHMRDERMDVVILDPDFDPIEQGAAFIMREINALRPAARRRVFVAHLSPAARTADTHAAFLDNVNLIVNHADIEALPRTLERALRDQNDLYRELNRALNLTEL